VYQVYEVYQVETGFLRLGLGFWLIIPRLLAYCLLGFLPINIQGSIPGMYALALLRGEIVGEFLVNRSQSWI